ncbi:hypothetical protein SKAU_G00006890 [Synaphobranchus kaupii]|uniref:Uncharacterized protein n=1 Tax=Synaphobranchus kaupii TaxID=118154 RepID=A0A9Q1GAG2_SYNKA|nr:hypothetical protein SKAU_G00006890 [Synaphobranchus kaupii]
MTTRESPDIKALQGTATADSLSLDLPLTLNQTHKDSSISTETRLEKSQFLCSTPAQWEDLVLLDHSYSRKGNEKKPPECNAYPVLWLGYHQSPPPRKRRRLVRQNLMSAETSNGHLDKPGPNIKTLQATAAADCLDLTLNQTHKESSISTETHREESQFLCSTPAQWEGLILLDHSYSSKGNNEKGTQTSQESLSSIPRVTFGPEQKLHVSCRSKMLEAPALKKTDLLTSSSVSQTVKIKFVHHDHEYGQRRKSTKEKLKAALGLIKHLEAEILGETPRESQFLLQRFQSDPGTIQFYTGFKDYDALTSAFSVLQPTAQSIGQFVQGLKVRWQERTECSSQQSKAKILFCKKNDHCSCCSLSISFSQEGTFRYPF